MPSAARSEVMRRRHAERRAELGIPDTKTCEQCGETYACRDVPGTPSHKEWLSRRFCTMACRDDFLRSENGPRGETHQAWLGDKAKPVSIRDRARKARIRTAPDWCGACGFMLVAEVHHKDGNPVNNDPSNLAFLCMGCHDLDHRGESVWEPAGVKVAA